jgi:hypothetical protein
VPVPLASRTIEKNSSCRYHWPRAPLRRIAVELEARRAETHPHHLGPKPKFSSTSNRKSHRTLSKALAMSDLRKKASSFPLCRARIKFWVYRKLSWMLRHFMKALCARDTITFNSGAKRDANSLEMTFLLSGSNCLV